MKPAQIKMLLTVTAGVMLAGFLMDAGRDIGIVASARNGFGS